MRYVDEWMGMNDSEKIQFILKVISDTISNTSMLRALMHDPDFKQEDKMIISLISISDKAIDDLYNNLYGNPDYKHMSAALTAAFIKWQCEYTTATTILTNIIKGRILNFEMDTDEDISFGKTTTIKLVESYDKDIYSFEITIVTEFDVKCMLNNIFSSSWRTDQDRVISKFDGLKDSYILNIKNQLEEYKIRSEFEQAGYYSGHKNIFGNAIVDKNTIVKKENGKDYSRPDFIGRRYITFDQFKSNVNNILNYPYSHMNRMTFNKKILYKIYGSFHDCPFKISDECYIIGNCSCSELCPIENAAMSRYNINLNDSDIYYLLKSSATWDDILTHLSIIRDRRNEEEKAKKLRQEHEEKERERERERIRQEELKKEDEEKKKEIDEIKRQHDILRKEALAAKKENIKKEFKEKRKDYVLGDLGDNKCPIVCFADGYLESTPGGFDIIMLLDSSISREKQKDYISKLDLYHICLDKLEEDLKIYDLKSGSKLKAANIAQFCNITNVYINRSGTILRIVFELKKKTQDVLLDIMVEDAVKKQMRMIGKKDRVYINSSKRKALKSHIMFNFDLDAINFKDKNEIMEDIIDILNRHYNHITKENVDKAIQYLLNHYDIIHELKSFDLEERLVI